MNTLKNEKLIIVGYGNHSGVITEAALLMGYKNIDYIVTDKSEPISIDGKTITNELPTNYLGNFFIAIGQNYLREKLYKEFIFKNPKSKFIRIIHPKSYISSSAKVDEGSVILPNAVIHTGCHIKRGVIININCHVDHNTIVEEFSSLSPSSTIGGNSRIGARSSLLLGSSVLSNLEVGEDVVIGANSCVHENIQKNSVCIGNPSRRIRFRKNDQNYMY